MRGMNYLSEDFWRMAMILVVNQEKEDK